MVRRFFSGFSNDPKISYPTMVFGCLTVVSIALTIIAECNDVVKTLSYCIFGVFYFAVLTILTMWVDNE